MSNSKKLENIYKLIRDHNFEPNTKVPDQLKCTKCKKILINSCQAPCGCRYCRNCISEMLADECQVCVGATSFCKDGKLSNFQTDYTANREILYLVVKCLEEKCPHRCELINMEDHMRLCLHRSVGFPLEWSGGDYENVANDGLDYDIKLESFNYNKILIEMVNNLKNEVTELKQDLLAKDKTIDRMKKEQDRIKKDEQISMINEDINLMKVPNTAIDLQQIEHHKPNSKRKAISIHQITHDKPVEELKYLLKTNDQTIIEWGICNVSDLKKKSHWIDSEFFNQKNDRYKMRLHLYNNLDRLYVYFYIYSRDNDATLDWPIEGNVTIKIANKSNPNACERVSKYCKFEKSYNNSFSGSDPFKFSFTELSSVGLIRDNCFIIECGFEMMQCV